MANNSNQTWDETLPQKCNLKGQKKIEHKNKKLKFKTEKYLVRNHSNILRNIIEWNMLIINSDLSNNSSLHNANFYNGPWLILHELQDR